MRGGPVSATVPHLRARQCPPGAFGGYL